MLSLEKETVNNELIVGILDIKATSHDVLIKDKMMKYMK